MYNYGGWGAQAQLPVGWEAKWDPGSRKWFYIDHATKTTHWELPQAARVAQAPYSHPQIEPKAIFVISLKSQYPSATDEVIKQILVSTNNNFIESKTRLESMGYRTKIETTPDPKLAKQLVADHISVSQRFESLLREHDNDLTAVKKALGEKGYQKKKAQIQPLDRLITTLEKDYPEAGNMAIKDVLISTNNSIINSRKALERMGYKKVSDVKKAAPVLSEATKKERVAKLKRRFPDLNERLIKMSLEGTKYDLEMAASVLQMSITAVEEKTSHTETSATSNVSTTGASNAAESRSFSTGTTNLEPVVFGGTTSGFEPVIFVSETSDRSASEVSIKNIPKQKTDMSQKPRNVTRVHAHTRKKVVVKKTVPSGYMSQNRCTSSGPNPDLVIGPNFSLLHECLIKPLGPDPTNRCGHQALNYNGPDLANVKGSAGLAVGPFSAPLLETMI